MALYACNPSAEVGAGGHPWQHRVQGHPGLSFLKQYKDFIEFTVTQNLNVGPIQHTLKGQGLASFLTLSQF